MDQRRTLSGATTAHRRQIPIVRPLNECELSALAHAALEREACREDALGEYVAGLASCVVGCAFVSSGFAGITMPACLTACVAVVAAKLVLDLNRCDDAYNDCFDRVRNNSGGLIPLIDPVTNQPTGECMCP